MLRRAGGPSSDVTVLMGKPQKLPDHSDYCCPIQIRGAGHERVMGICGVDSFKALQLALSTLAFELDALNRELDGKLRWECDAKGKLGFPDTV